MEQHSSISEERPDKVKHIICSAYPNSHNRISNPLYHPTRKSKGFNSYFLIIFSKKD